MSIKFGGTPTPVKPGNGIWKVTVGPNKVYEGYNPNFGANSLAKIKKACQNNEIPASWHVGDEKQITYTYNGNSYTDRIILVDKTEGRYKYSSDNSYTHATFMIVPSRQDTYLTGSAMGGNNRKKYSENTVLLGDIATIYSRYNVTSSDGTNLSSLLENIVIKSMTGSSTATEDFTCMLFIPSCGEMISSPPTTDNTTASYKTGSNLGTYSLFITTPIDTYQNIYNYTYYFGENVNIWSRDYAGTTNRYYFYRYTDYTYVRTASSSFTNSDIVCFSW